MVLSTLLAFLLLSDRPLNFGAITEAEHNPLFGINGQGVDHGVPNPLIEFGHKILCSAQFFEVDFDSLPLYRPLGKVLLQGIVLGFDGFVIGGGSVVVKDIPSNSVAVGNPCKVIRPITEDDKKTYWDW